jgi:tetratricopeptide (TPR) repeat protein
MRLRRKTPSASEAIAEAERLLTEGTPEERVAFTKDAIAKFPLDPDLRYYYALTLMGSESERARAELLHSAELDDKDDPVRLARVANMLLDLDDRDSARALAERAAGKETNVPTADLLHRVRGVIAVHDRDYALAERELRAAHDSDPADEFAAKDLGWALVRMNRFDDAFAVVDRTLATPVGAGANREHARLLLMNFRARAEKTRRSVEAKQRREAPTDRA